MGDAQEAAGNLKRKRMWKPVRVLGLDGAYVLGWGEKRAVMVAVDLGEGKPVAVGYVDEHNPDAVRRWLEPIAKRLGVSVIVTDDLMQYKTVAEKLDLSHQICQFHVRRWVGLTLHELQTTLQPEWLWVLEEIKALLAQLPLDGGRRLFELWKQIPERRAGRDQPRSAVEQLRDYLEQRNGDKILIANIESTPAIENLDAICAVPGLDAVLIGPHDLSCSLGIPEQYDHPRFHEAVQTIFSTARRHGVGAGIHYWLGLDREIAWAQTGGTLSCTG